MPVVVFHLVEGRHPDAAVGRLLERACVLFADVLETPVARVRAFAQTYPAQRVAVGGSLVSDGAAEAPFFQFALLAGRPEEQRRRLLAGFTDLLVDILGADRSLVRGGIWTVAPEDWTIGGATAADLRADEIRARAESAGG